MYGLSTGPKEKKSGRCGGVAVSGGSTVSILNGITIPMPLRQSRPQEFLKPHILFYPDSCERCVKPPLESGFKTLRFR